MCAFLMRHLFQICRLHWIGSHAAPRRNVMPPPVCVGSAATAVSGSPKAVNLRTCGIIIIMAMPEYATRPASGLFLCWSLMVFVYQGLVYLMLMNSASFIQYMIHILIISLERFSLLQQHGMYKCEWVMIVSGRYPMNIVLKSWSCTRASVCTF